MCKHFKCGDYKEMGYVNWAKGGAMVALTGAVCSERQIHWQAACWYLVD
jgi:hypothetical protein